MVTDDQSSTVAVDYIVQRVTNTAGSPAIPAWHVRSPREKLVSRENQISYSGNASCSVGRMNKVSAF